MTLTNRNLNKKTLQEFNQLTNGVYVYNILLFSCKYIKMTQQEFIGHNKLH